MLKLEVRILNTQLFLMIALSSIEKISDAIGFNAFGVSRVTLLHNKKEILSHWLSENMNGDMGYMARNVDKRLNPALLVEGAKSVVSVLVSYYAGSPSIATNAPKISRYAISADYHTTIRQMLWQMLDMLRQQFGPIAGRAFVDSAPVLERAWAQKASLGWIGKNGMLINPNLGSYTFIGQLIVDVDIEPSTAEQPNRCGTCTRCIDACPAGAIIKPGVIDARKCISYLTIEKRTPLTDKEKSSLKGWCFGCDICQEVCPWNSELTVSSDLKIKPKTSITQLSPDDIRGLTSHQFDGIFKDTPVSRAGYDQFMLNCKGE
ncbi:MAG: tRNA epoxyqueuosine(34) reductase QueG [Tenuifilaceae bacterium]|nr:tRNA epoxyqueuosine(34) reductase QueG [Tenuifilaceae bacterium]